MSLLVAETASHHTVPMCKVSTSDIVYFLRHHLTKESIIHSTPQSISCARELVASVLDPEGGSQKATLVVVLLVVISFLAYKNP